MAKSRGKLKSVLKKINSLANPRHCIPTPSSAAVSADDDDLRTVYVGRSRKRYLLSPSVVDHPLFRELVKRTGEHSRDDDGVSINVGSEVVLFEHLLWMLEDESDRHDQPESVNELVGFYACS